MLIIAALITSLAPISRHAPAVPQKERAEVRAQFESLHEKGDRAGCVALWRENEGLVLPVIDADLEGSLKILESAARPDMSRIAKMRERAVWGARCAEEATGHPILVDYASSFIGWTAEQTASFRAGQAAYHQAGEAEKNGEHRVALEAATQCLELAAGLGDWWGAAMGYEMQGRAYQRLAQLDDALRAYSQARLLDHDLGLIEDEYGNARSMVDMCYALERSPRGLQVATQALALARQLHDDAGAKELAEKKATFEERLGDKDGAAKTREEARGAK